MNKKKIIIAAGLVFCVVELAAVLIGVWPRLFQHERRRVFPAVLRLGILPLPSKAESKRFWDPIVNSLSQRMDNIRVAPYYANSYEELLTALVHGSLDLAYVNPMIFVSARHHIDVEPVARGEIYRGDVEGDNRAVLSTLKNIHFIRATKGARLTFVDRLCLSGYTMPEHYLSARIPGPLNQWFAKIAYSRTHAQAVSDMIQDRTDVIATDRYMLSECVRLYGFPDTEIKNIWMSKSVLPRNLVCANADIVSTKMIQQARSAFTGLSLLNADGEPYRAFVAPEPTDYYETEVETLSRVDRDAATAEREKDAR